MPFPETESPRRKLLLERGLPLTPYLASADCAIETVHYNERERSLRIGLRGLTGQNVELAVVSPAEPQREAGAGRELSVTHHGGVREILIRTKLRQSREEVEIRFDQGQE
jgi:hypothetical protein